MFDIGFPELILIAIVGLLVIGPERLPEALRTLGLWIGRMRRSFTNVKTEIEKEIGMDEIRRQLHNEAVMEEMKRIERDVRDSVRAGEQTAGKETQRRDAAGNRIEPYQPGGADTPSANEPVAQETPDSTAPLPAGEGEPERPTTPPAGADDRQHG